MKFIHEWQKMVHWVNQEHGFYDDLVDRNNIDKKLLLAVGELIEAQNEMRNGHKTTEIYWNPDKPDKPEGFPIELADAVIRIMDIAEHQGFDLEVAMALKHEYNKTRPYKHGKAF